jgi:flagellar motor protein MotB
MALVSILADLCEIIEVRDQRITDRESEAVVDPEDVRIVKTRKKDWEQNAPKDDDIRPYFSNLVLQVQELARLRDEMEALVEKHQVVTTENQQLGETNERLNERLTQLEAELSKAEEELSRVRAQLAEARQRDGHTWPPIIRLKEAEGFRFAVGDARLREQFKEQLTKEVIPTILTYITEYNVDVIEIVGHTDEQPVIGRQSNLDAALLPFLTDDRQAVLRAADNAGLGMARAATVASFLRQDERLADYTILPLSSAHVMDVTGQVADGTNRGDVPDRRRIEIRLRRSESG